MLMLLPLLMPVTWPTRLEWYLTRLHDATCSAVQHAIDSAPEMPAAHATGICEIWLNAAEVLCCSIMLPCSSRCGKALMHAPCAQALSPTIASAPTIRSSTSSAISVWGHTAIQSHT